MTGTLSDLDELRRRDDGFLAVTLVAKFGNGDGARVAAHAEKRIIAYVKTRRQIGRDRRMPGAGAGACEHASRAWAPG